eukprot:413568-Rhodomonas_salina.1
MERGALAERQVAEKGNGASVEVMITTLASDMFLEMSKAETDQVCRIVAVRCNLFRGCSIVPEDFFYKQHKDLLLKPVLNQFAEDMGVPVSDITFAIQMSRPALQPGVVQWVEVLACDEPGLFYNFSCTQEQIPIHFVHACVRGIDTFGGKVWSRPHNNIRRCSFNTQTTGRAVSRSQALSNLQSHKCEPEGGWRLQPEKYGLWRTEVEEDKGDVQQLGRLRESTAGDDNCKRNSTADGGGGGEGIKRDRASTGEGGERELEGTAERKTKLRSMQPLKKDEGGR